MKIVERLLLKIIVIQLIMLVLSQLFFHKMNALPEWQQLTQYEGVSENQYNEFLETLSGEYRAGLALLFQMIMKSI